MFCDHLKEDPLAFFMLFFPQQRFELMAHEANAYSTLCLDSPVDMSPKSRFQYCNKHMKLRPNTTRFCEIMSQNRYKLLSWFMHFNNDTKQVSKGEPGYDPLYKMRPMIDMMRPLFKHHYTPERKLTVDESMQKFKGRLYFTQYMPNKRTKWGIKLSSLCERNHATFLILTFIQVNTPVMMLTVV